MQRRGTVKIALLRASGVLAHECPHFAHSATRHSIVDELVVGCVREGGAEDEDVSHPQTRRARRWRAAR